MNLANISVWVTGLSSRCRQTKAKIIYRGKPISCHRYQNTEKTSRSRTLIYQLQPYFVSIIIVIKIIILFICFLIYKSIFSWISVQFVYIFSINCEGWHFRMLLIIFKIRQDIFFFYTRFFCALMNKCVPFHSPWRPQLCQIVLFIPIQVGYSGRDRNKIKAATSKTKRENKIKRAAGGCGTQWKPVSRRYECLRDVLTAGGGRRLQFPVSLGMSINYYFYFQVLVPPPTDAESVWKRRARTRLPYKDK